MLSCFLLGEIVGRGACDQGAKMAVTVTTTILAFF